MGWWGGRHNKAAQKPVVRRRPYLTALSPYFLLFVASIFFLSIFCTHLLLPLFSLARFTHTRRTFFRRPVAAVVDGSAEGDAALGGEGVGDGEGGDDVVVVGGGGVGEGGVGGGGGGDDSVAGSDA